MLIKQSCRIEQKSDILFVLFSPGSVETDVEWDGKLNCHLTTSCLRNIRTKNYQNPIIFLRVIVENVGDVFFGTQCNVPRVQTCLSLPVLTVAEWLPCFDDELYLVKWWQTVEVLPLQPQKCPKRSSSHKKGAIFFYETPCTFSHTEGHYFTQCTNILYNLF